MSDIHKAFIAAQAAMEPARKGATNPAFRSKYADLGAVQDACFPAFHANGFGVRYVNGTTETGGHYVETILAHESGEQFSTRVPLIIGKNDMQGLGSAITYARRYGLLSLAGIAPEDDDGNAAVKNAQRRNPADEGIRQAREDAVADGMANNSQSKRGLTKRRGEEILAELAACDSEEAFLEYVDTLEPHEAAHEKIKPEIDRLTERFGPNIPL